MVNPSNPLPQKPVGVIASLSAGMDAVVRGWSVVAFPVALDLFLWFGRRLSIQPVAEQVVKELVKAVGQTPAFDLVLKASSEINYFSLISVAPLGIPSLMSAKLPQSNPLGTPGAVTIDSQLAWLALFAGLSLVGLFLGGIYLGMIAQQVRDGRLNLPRLFGLVPRYWVSVVALILILLILTGILAVPVLLMATLAANLSSWIASLIVWSGSLMVIWLLFHLVFAVHGLLLSEEALLKAVLSSLRLTAFNSFPVMGLLALVIAISTGLNFVWSLPSEDSWMLLLGILGHAVISSGLIAATFVFYQDRYRYWREMRNYLAKPQAAGP